MVKSEIQMITSYVSKEKIFIAGSNGMVGSAISKLLLRKDYE